MDVLLSGLRQSSRHLDRRLLRVVVDDVTFRCCDLQIEVLLLVGAETRSLRLA